ncbi:MAG: cyclic nucleotide-binding domain-containing protein [Methylotenera sp.]|nr:cyclic nucleotide-binding domain-containing protein [Methylotenera sp.]
MAIADQTLFEQLEPIARLSAGRKKELASLCFIETVNKDIDPLRMNVARSAQALYLISGELELHFENENMVMQGGSEAAKQPFNNHANIKNAVAKTNIEVLRIDMDLLDIMMTWDQLSHAEIAPKPPQEKIAEKPKAASKVIPKITPEIIQEDNPSIADNIAPKTRTTGEWMSDTGVFSAFNLQKGVFSQLPTANVEEMFKRMTSVPVKAGQVMVKQGSAGDYYYLIQSGAAVVSRVVDANQPIVILAELQEGSAFGEEALVSDAKRNATVTMSADGELLRLNKKDFVELLKAPLITQISMADANAQVNAGAVWADVRLPSEYEHDHITGAINLPLDEIRKHARNLDPNKTYISYCQTGRRSSAAAFILVQSGFKAVVLKGGTRAG